jgi:hypothetical protein
MTWAAAVDRLIRCINMCPLVAQFYGERSLLFRRATFLCLSLFRVRGGAAQVVAKPEIWLHAYCDSSA